ncbi:putative endo-beta-N-acetylglucosaminidase precursor [Clostridium puniceum]|uniref:Putative endo-beta-N-acetylglucosaminidase n=1 Tax=Clostridium puniceum TaxID=29367 RepID=A0A1S8TC85_9CLOT|nr:N-acetylmuramoyl-L-alanine amidase family protein [Clostridium puniceum]OOM75437.1 putative endo-beta-N-acetylglucosaminidase precursor [Clostridium puniceum]
MIKRISKLNALLLTATAFVSIIPATSANAATKLETLTGTLESVQAFDGGKYIYDGYKDNNQDTSIYLFNGTKDIEINNVTSLEGAIKYGKNDLSFNNSKKTLLNLSTGSVEDETIQDKYNFMKIKLSSSVIKKVKRYKDLDLASFNVNTTQLNSNQFGDVWYEYSINDSKVQYKGYVSIDGTYIDASETANITFYASSTKNTYTYNKVTFDKMKDTKKVDGITYSLREGNTLFADSGYIYRIVEVISDNSIEVASRFIQKISKTKGNTVDGAYIPNSVESYEISTSDYSTLTNSKSQVRLIDSSIYVITNEANQLSISKFDLTKSRDNSDSSKTSDRISRVKLDDTYNDIKNENATAYDIDVNGNVWILYKGSISKVVKGSLSILYTVDKSMTNLSVYDDNDIVTWNKDNDIYSVVNGKAGNGTDTGKNPVTTGWVSSNGAWSYINADGSKATGWVKIGPTWYFLNSNGIMQTGWIKDGSSWYYLNTSGAMQTSWIKDGSSWYYLKPSGDMATGWVNDGGLWYYLNSSGAMLSNTTVDGYKLGPSGAWIK